MNYTEDVLRHLWNKRYLTTHTLISSAGDQVTVIDFGTLNRGAGPDFQNAAVIINGTLYRGDIEFHLSADGWDAHHHSYDVQYNSIVLHVVLLEEKSKNTILLECGRTVPTVVLADVLKGTVEELIEHFIRDESASRSSLLPCSGRTEKIASEIIGKWMHTLWIERMKEKTNRYAHRLTEIASEQALQIAEPYESLDSLNGTMPDVCVERGALNRPSVWNQLLYEGMMECLGYSKNKEPMVRLAQILPLTLFRDYAKIRQLTVHDIRGMLFASAGLLPYPSECTDVPSRVEVHSMCVGNETLGFIPREMLDPGIWHNAPTRPANLPPIRLAAAGVFIKNILHANVFRSVITAMAASLDTDERVKTILKLLEIPQDPFWSYHFGFEETTPVSHAILGSSRKNDIFINAVIPFCCLYATVFERADICGNALCAGESLPHAESNFIVRAVERHVTRDTFPLRTMAHHQGAIQLHKKYCTAGRCSECAIGTLVFGDSVL